MRGFKPWPGTFSSFREKTCQVWGRPAAEADSLGSGRALSGAAAGTLFAVGHRLFAACGAASVLEIESIRIEVKKRGSERSAKNCVRNFTPRRIRRRVRQRFVACGGWRECEAGRRRTGYR